MTYLYSATIGIALCVLLYTVIRYAVEAGVTSALRAFDSDQVIRLIRNGVANGLELNRKAIEFDEDNG